MGRIGAQRSFFFGEGLGGAREGKGADRFRCLCHGADRAKVPRGVGEARGLPEQPTGRNASETPAARGHGYFGVTRSPRREERVSGWRRIGLLIILWFFLQFRIFQG